MGLNLWAFFFSLAAAAPAAHAADGSAASGIPGAVTYPAGAGSGGTKSGAKPSLVVPTPDTIPPPNLNGTSNGNANGSSNGIPVATPGPKEALGRCRKKSAGGETTVDFGCVIDMRYKHSVVRVTAKDLAGNVLARAMGVAVGRSAQYIAAPLSLVLGSSQQWADRIEVQHFTGNKYEANVSLIDEEKNLVILAPEAAPAPIVFAREQEERPQVDIWTVSIDNGPNGTFTSSVHRGRVAAANPDTGLLSISPFSNEVINDEQAGTGIIDAEGNLLGMLLPGGRGVLASTLQKSIAKAQKTTPIEPRMIGVILGRGVLVDQKLDGAFRSVSEALEAIKKGTAPKTDPTRYTPARNRTVAPKETDKVVIKVMPGTYKEKKPIILPPDTSLSGSGPGQTVLQGTDPEKPVLLLQNGNNMMVAGFRIVPANLQALKAPAVIVSKANKVTLLGNVFEAKGGVGVWVHDSNKVSFFGNTFARGTVRGLSCDKSAIQLEANAFVGDWPIGISLDKECSSVVKRNLFFENKNSVSVASTAGTSLFEENTFIRSGSAIKLSGSTPGFSLHDSVFYECPYGLYGGGEINQRNLGRNAAWKSKFTARSRTLAGIDLVRTEPSFEAPESYDFRIKPGKGHVGSAVRNPGADLGAYQRADFLGPYSGPLARSLGAVTGEDDLAGAWGLNE